MNFIAYRQGFFCICILTLLSATFEKVIVPRQALTYMSIADHVQAQVCEGCLFHIEPLDPSSALKRVMVVSDEIWRLIDGPWSNKFLERRGNRLRADLEAFVKGDNLSISMTPYEHRVAYMGLLAPPERGYWDIRSRDPQPGLRVLGHFAKIDLFVALVWYPRSVEVDGRLPLKSSRGLNWEVAKLQCEEAWQKLFPSHMPQVREEISDLVSENTFLV